VSRFKLKELKANLYYEVHDDMGSHVCDISRDSVGLPFIAAVWNRHVSIVGTDLVELGGLIADLELGAYRDWVKGPGDIERTGQVVLFPLGISVAGVVNAD